MTGDLGVRRTAAWVPRPTSRLASPRRPNKPACTTVWARRVSARR